jgi:hypothetical protein
MPRGKVHVQHEHDLRQDMTRVLDRPAEITVFPATDSDGYAASPLAAHLVDQLRYAYDELRNEPIPPHLQELLDDLCKAEEES